MLARELLSADLLDECSFSNWMQERFSRSEVHIDDELIVGLGFDSLELVELAVVMDDLTDQTLPTELVESIRTVRDAFELARNFMGPSSSHDG